MEQAKVISLGVAASAVGYEAFRQTTAIAKAVRVKSYEVDPRHRPSSDEDTRTADLPPTRSVREMAASAQEGGVAVVRANLDEFLSRARAASALTNCVTETLEDHVARDIGALAALTADERKRLPLCGVPVSLKECYQLTGTDSTHGLSRYLGRPLSQDAVLVAAVRAAGGVPFCKTNVSQLMLSWECSNPAYGTTSHPLHRSFVPGGSSGGESCLVAQGGSVIGLGTDVGGSCRIPAHMAGCVGIKATKGRFSQKGKGRLTDHPYSDGQQIIASCAGILGRTVDDAMAFMEAVLSPDVLKLTRDLDCYQLPIPWDREAAVAEGPLRIGYYEEDGFSSCSPACRRAVRESVEALRRAGHELVPFHPPDVFGAFSTYVGLLSSGIHLQAAEMEGEEPSDFISRGLYGGLVPEWLKRLLSRLLADLSPMTAALLPHTSTKSATEYYRYVAAAQLYKDTFQSAMDASGVDLLLCPVHALPAHPQCTSKDFSTSCSYTALFNLIDYPAGTVPVTELRQTDTWSEGEATIDALIDKSLQEAYARALATGCPFPVGAQLVARPYREELLLRGLRDLEREVGIKEPVKTILRSAL